MVEVVETLMTNLSDSETVKLERRCVVRRSLSLLVNISDNEGFTYNFITKNIAMGGVFICADSALVQPGEIIESKFFLNHNGLYKTYCVEVQVKHINSDGFGVCFDQDDSGLFRYIYEIIYEPTDQVLARKDDVMFGQCINS